MPLTLPVRRRSSHTSPRTSSVPRPMPSRRRALPPRQERASARANSSAGGSATSFRRRFGSSSSTTSDCGTTSAGRCSTAERTSRPDDALARRTRRTASPSCQDGGMERVLGIGGYFLRTSDPVALGAWYPDCLGLDADENGLWRPEAGPTVFATFESETDYFGSRDQQVMINFRVGDLDAMLAQLRAKGADVAPETQDMEGVGRFGWVTDPEGNRIELWQAT